MALLFSSFPFAISLDNIAKYVWVSHTSCDGGDSMKSIQKLGSFGTGYIEVKKMTEKEIECGAGENVTVIVSVFLKAVSGSLSQWPHRFLVWPI